MNIFHLFIYCCISFSLVIPALQTRNSGDLAVASGHVRSHRLLKRNGVKAYFAALQAALARKMPLKHDQWYYFMECKKPGASYLNAMEIATMERTQNNYVLPSMVQSGCSRVNLVVGYVKSTRDPNNQVVFTFHAKQFHVSIWGSLLWKLVENEYSVLPNQPLIYGGQTRANVYEEENFKESVQDWLKGVNERTAPLRSCKGAFMDTRGCRIYSTPIHGQGKHFDPEDDRYSEDVNTLDFYEYIIRTLEDDK